TESDLKVNPQNDGDVVRIVLPSLTEERRQEMARVVSKEKEDSRVSAKQIREDSWDQVQEMTKEGKISEDDKFRAKDKLQEIMDKFNEELDGIAEKKEEEIMKL
ncbi:MAG: ribosome-recycling factor, partial [Spirochaetota bacterium]